MYFSVMIAESVTVSTLRQEIFEFNKFWVRDPVSSCYRYFEGLSLTWTVTLIDLFLSFIFLPLFSCRATAMEWILIFVSIISYLTVENDIHSFPAVTPSSQHRSRVPLFCIMHIIKEPVSACIMKVVQFSCWCQVIDLLHCFLLKETTFVLSRSLVHVLLH